MEKEKKNEAKNSEKKVEVSNIDFKESALDCVNVFKTIITKPVDTIKDFVVDNKFVSGIIMILVTAITAGIYKLATLKSVYDQVNIGYFKSPKPEYLKEFFTTCGNDLLRYALIVAIGYLIINKCLKGKTSVKQMINAVAISLSLVLVVNLVNSILVFIDGEAITYIRSYLFSFSAIFSYLVLYKSIKETSSVDQNKLFVSVASIAVLATVVIDVLDKLFNK